jgi:galactosylxylosylprotein 3-beta-galactosyltransferase
MRISVTTRLCGILIAFALFQCFCLKFITKQQQKAPDTAEYNPPSVTLKSPLINCSREGVILQAKKKDVFLLVLILSSIANRERRDVIRQTWMDRHQMLSPNVVIKFTMGTDGLSEQEVNSLKMENNQFNDLLLLEDLQDSYHNLTLKVLRSFITINEMYTAVSYVFKGDDDTYVLLDKVHQELANRQNKQSLYWGFFNGRAKVKKKGKWKETGWFLSGFYLPYALGGGYVISGDLLQYIARNADGLQLYNSEDVSVGVWLSGFKAERRHDVRFNTEFVSRGCRNVYIVSHKQSIEEMMSKYRNLKEIDKQCLREYQTRKSYIYNWTAQPVDCCKRLSDIP